MNIHPCHIRLAIALDHAKELPSVPFIKTDMVSHQIGRRNPVGSQILYSHVQQFSGDALASVTLLSVNGADIGGQIGSVVEVIFNHTQTADDLTTVQTQEPTQLGFLSQISLHTFQIGFLGTPHLLWNHSAAISIRPGFSLNVMY